jgi:hypothetical protein
VTDEQVPDTLVRRDPGENGMQVILTQLARSTTGRGERREGGIRATELVPHDVIVSAANYSSTDARAPSTASRISW